MKKKDYSLKLEQQLVRMEGIIEALLDSIAISDLNAAERLLIASRFAALHQRGLAIGHTFEMDEPENRENSVAVAFRRFVRHGAEAFSDPQATGVVDSELRSTEITSLKPRLDVDDVESD